MVTTAGFKEGSWLDNDGHPHTEALRTTERFRRTSFGAWSGRHDRRPEGVLRPWTAETMRLRLQPDTELLEHLCENNRDLDALQQIWRERTPAAPPATGR